MKSAILEVFNQVEKSTIQLKEKELLIVVKKIFEDYNLTFEWINVIIMNSDEHTTMNDQYLGHNYPTDILTFEFEEGENMNGELYLNIDVAQVNGNEYGVSLENELSRLIIHGALHLIGQDDHSEEEKARMKTLEDSYLRLIYD